MLCNYCGTEMDENAKFCRECGRSVIGEGVRLSCRDCGAPLVPDGKEPTLTCPYCGGKELVREDAEVVKAKAAVEQIRRREEAKDAKKEEKASLRDRYWHSFLRHFTVILVIVCLFFALDMLMVENGSYSAALFIATGLGVISWLFGMQLLPDRGGHMKKVFLSMACLCAAVVGLAQLDTVDLPRHDNWPTKGIAQVIPEPQVKVGSLKIEKNDLYDFVVAIRGIKRQDSEAYLAQCKESGFTLDAVSEVSGHEYRAYNAEGYRLDLSYWSSDKSLDLHVTAPIELTVFTWPPMGAVSKWPAPETDSGKVESQRADRFKAILGKMDRDAFNAYVEEWIAAGFDRSYARYEYKYEANNHAGSTVALEYIGNDMVRIEVKVSSSDINRYSK